MFQGVPNGGVFNAQQYEPQQGGSKHPIGNFPAKVSNTQIVAAKDEKSGMFRVTFETPAGTIDKNYNLWHDNAQTVEIAHKQLSALCHAVGRFQVNMANQGRELVGALCSIEVGWQSGQEPSSEKPQGGYVEVKKVFDQAGNEPGKVGQAPQPQGQAGWGNQQPQQAPVTVMPQQQQPQAWGQPQQAPAPAQQQPGWGQPQGNPPPNQPAWAQK